MGLLINTLASTDAIVRVYANLVERGRDINTVPANIRPAVIEELKRRGTWVEPEE